MKVYGKVSKVVNYPASMVKNLMELVVAAELNSLNELRSWRINRRVYGVKTSNYVELYACITDPCQLADNV